MYSLYSLILNSINLKWWVNYPDQTVKTMAGKKFAQAAIRSKESPNRPSPG